jgi:hypothetical protein
MGTLNDWAVVDANNNATPPDGWPENTMNYSDVNNTGRSVQGTVKRFFADINGSLDAAGAADAYTLTLNESGYVAYFDGMMFSCTIPIINATPTPTIDVNGIGPANIVGRDGMAVGIGELHAGGIYDFRHDGTNVRVIGGQGVAGANSEFQFNNNGEQAGAVGFTYDNSGNIANAVNPLGINADLYLTAQPDHVSADAAGFGIIWVRTDGLLIYTDPSGVDTAIGTSGLSVPGGVTTNLQYNDAGAFAGMAEFVFDNAATTGPQFTITPLAGLTTGALLSLSANQAGFDGTLLSIFNDNIGSTGDAVSIVSDAAGKALYVNQQNNFIGVQIEQTINNNLLLLTGASTTFALDINMATFNAGIGIRIIGSNAATTNMQSRVSDSNSADNNGLQIIHEFGVQNQSTHMLLTPHPNVSGEPLSTAGRDGGIVLDDNDGFIWQKMVDGGGLTNKWWCSAIEKKFQRVLTTSGVLHTVVSNMPTWVTEVIIIMANISTNGVSPIKITVGPSGSPVLTGYNGRCTSHDGASAHATKSWSSGFHIGTIFVASTGFSGTMRLTWSDLTEIWNAELLGHDSVGRVIHGGGSVDITGNVDTIELDTDGHTDTFDAGEFTVILRGAGRSSTVF